MRRPIDAVNVRPSTGNDTRSLPVKLAEALAVALAGGALGWVVGRSLDLGIWFGVPAAVNGAISGLYGIYDWWRPRGWAAAVLDSTWGLVGTIQALMVHGINLAVPKADYLEAESYRRNRHVYNRGIRVRGPFALAAGNVISNGGGLVGLAGSSAAAARRRRFVTDHEELHVWQSRALGPAFQLLYVLWLIAGAAVGVLMWPFVNATLNSVVETVAYYNNPFEYWAYRRDGFWPPSGAHSGLAWGARRRAAASSHDHGHD